MYHHTQSAMDPFLLDGGSLEDPCYVATPGTHTAVFSLWAEGQRGEGMSGLGTAGAQTVLAGRRDQRSHAALC